MAETRGSTPGLIVGLIAAAAMFLFVLILFVITVGQRDALECTSHRYAHANSGNVMTMTVDGHRYTDVKCKGS